MTANRNIIYYVPVDADGVPTEAFPRCAQFDVEQDAWVDADNGVIIEFLGLILGENAVFSSTNQLEVERWIKSPNTH